MKKKNQKTKIIFICVDVLEQFRNLYSTERFKRKIFMVKYTFHFQNDPNEANITTTS